MSYNLHPECSVESGIHQDIARRARVDERAKMHALLLQMRDGWWWAGSFLGASPDQYARAHHWGAGQALDFAANHLRSMSPLGLPTTEREQKK